MSDRLKHLYDNARKKTFEYNGAKITVRESLGIDKMDMSIYRRFVRGQLLEERNNGNSKKNQVTVLGDIDWNRILNFVLFATRTTSIEGKMTVEFRLPTSEDDEQVWYDSYWQFLSLPGDLIEKWDDALIDVDKVEPDPEAVPDDEKSMTVT